MAGTRMALGNTRMDEEDEILNVKWSLVVRVWGSDTRSIRVWNWAIRVWLGQDLGNTRMGIGDTRMGRIVISCAVVVQFLTVQAE
jgi:hypothetical protein